MWTLSATLCITNSSIFPTIPDIQNGRGKCCMHVSTWRTKYDTGLWFFSPSKHWLHPIHSLSSHILQLILSSYISHHKDESKQKLALQQDDSIHITNETVENCANLICILRQLEYDSNPTKMRWWPTEQVTEHCPLQTATKLQVGRWHMRTRLKVEKKVWMHLASSLVNN